MISPTPKLQFLDSNGNPLVGGKLYTYLSGTTTPTPSYTTEAGNVANTNPVILDSRGEAIVFLNPLINYTFYLTTSVDVPVWPAPVDGVNTTNGALAILAQSTGSALVGYTLGASGSTTTTVQAYLRRLPISVKDYGALGDGSTNDTAAFVAASARITALDGGHLIIPYGEYIVGSQTFAGTTGLGYSYQGTRIIKINNCAYPVVIEFQGARLKMPAGLKFGSFSPTTGNSFTPGSLPFVDSDYAAGVGVMIDVQDNASVTIRGGGELDGNIQNATLGGQWGDTGYQCVGYGILAYGNASLVVQDIYTHHHCLDGIATGWAGITETDTAKPVTLERVVSEYNARQGWSVVGGIEFTAIGCKFNHTGKSTFSSAPSAGIDLEAESAVVRNVTLINCETVNNTGVGLLADSGDNANISAYSCRFVGTTTWSVWPKMPRMRFYNCTIAGSLVNPYADTTYPDNACQFHDCKITDFLTSGYGGATYAPGNLLNFGSVTNVLMNNCFIQAGRQKLGDIQNAILYDCTFAQSAGTNVSIANQDWVLYLNGSKFRNLKFIDAIEVANRPADAYYVSLNGTEEYSGQSFLTSAASKVRWINWLSGAGGFTGALGQNQGNLAPNTYVALAKSTGNRLVGFYGQLKIVAGPAAPTTDTWAVGDRCINSNPIVGQPKGWACTVAGTPGTWVSEGNL